MEYQKIANWKKLAELQRIKELTTLPKEIFYIGDWKSDLFQNCVAVVGSRRMTEYGRQVIEKIIPQLIFKKQTVVSGFMYGVDQYAHRVTAESGGKTIAVLGWGIRYPLEGSDLKLARTIVESGGLLLSEWEKQPPSHWTFPSRNRIIAALSSEVIIIEAAEKSGSLITARIANRLKRKIWAVPGPITSRYSFGTNSLIAKDQADMWLPDFEVKDTPSASDPLLRLIDEESLSANEIARKLKLPVSQIGAQLSLLTLLGKVREKGGKYYIDHAD